MNIETRQSISAATTGEDEYEEAKREREACILQILQLRSNKKIIVAGPGTGKTYLFRRILAGKNKTLTLTFVNSLVEDLTLDLCGLSDVRTLHSFAREIMARTKKSIKLFPKLGQVIREDARVLLNKHIDFDYLFHNRDDGNEHIAFFKERKDFYGYYGYADIVYAAVKYLERKKDKIPMFDQVVVDELQDFNTLEMSLIDLLAEKSPILLAGDDDQALYESLKSASPLHLRQRYNERSHGYDPFSLPFCSRCTRVIVDAVNDIIVGAVKGGNLNGRIDKPFQYFVDKEKDRACEQNGKLVHCKAFSTQIPWFIQTRIEQIAQDIRKKFTVLIISPTKNQSRRIANAMKGRGFRQVQYVEKRDSAVVSLLDGLKLLLENPKCNLGWRIVVEQISSDDDFNNLLKQTYGGDPKTFLEVLGSDLRKKVNGLLESLRSVSEGEAVENRDAFDDLLGELEIDPYTMATESLKAEIASDGPVGAKASVRKIPITATTIQSSKGLAEDYVFITHVDDLFLVRDPDKSKISDQDICNILVALTRARKKVFLISSDPKATPTFLTWIDKNRIESIDLTVKK